MEGKTRRPAANNSVAGTRKAKRPAASFTNGI
jgi:hypothetical protein